MHALPLPTGPVANRLKDNEKPAAILPLLHSIPLLPGVLSPVGLPLLLYTKLASERVSE